MSSKALLQSRMISSTGFPRSLGAYPGVEGNHAGQARLALILLKDLIHKTPRVTVLDLSGAGRVPAPSRGCSFGALTQGM